VRPRLSPYEAAVAAWRIDGELRGHSPSETIRWASDMGDLDDAERSHGSRSSFVISPPAEPRFVAWWRLRRRLTAVRG
ncbi:MAG: hypothetical protein QOD72_1168, partial [Acidimicrobiaceae bacterium]|nr:hypothetical protein [Acidimicrobiaceae bacterium]